MSDQLIVACPFCARDKRGCACYEKRLKKMTDRQVLAELKRIQKPQGVMRGNLTLSTILELMFEGHLKGKS